MFRLSNAFVASVESVSFYFCENIHYVRALSALGFVISIIGLLFVFYDRFAVIPHLRELESPKLISSDYLIVLTEKYTYQHHLVSILCIIIGSFSVVFCSFIYLRKRTRMTLVGTIVGFIVATMGLIQSW